ncbi:two-component system, OmpR family, sensor kinase [Actinoplanes sp. SE50]|uniref:sensor histidine kinase n=1 Tax=unclassified Actinoplanes TaxID=2626549 RepID=UPI00023EC472|nr:MULTISPECIES: HAMP domain-containing sensor histidine kinase [unclassified Actinoplanes]AEV84637.1 two-component system, OmpR family, sensor kinase [Actinoplanes sp. SE50/110]ATO83029.1 two-component system, OmpR family, sensor kinase [Actinoplanes sp. SE50]SLM00437.1 signal transduction histidine kinase [Actinoplanes sp. SE50/110]
MRGLAARRGSGAWQGLRGRLLAGTLALLAAGLLVADASAYAALRTFLGDRVDVTLRSLASRIDEQAGRGTGAAISWETVRVLAPGTQYVAVLDPDGRLLVAHAAVSGSEDLTPPVLPTPIPATSEPFTAPSAGAGPGYRLAAITLPGAPPRITLTIGGVRVHPAALIVGVSLADVDATLHRLLLVEVIASTAILVAGVAVATLVLGFGLRPLRTVADTARAIAGGQRERRIPVPHPHSEIGRVAAELNAAFSEREEAEARIRRFVADASHELRTPLTTVRGWSDLYLNGGVSQWEQADLAFARIGAETGRMQRLVEDLILLARLDARRPLDRAPVDVGAVLGGLVADLSVVEPERSVSLRVPPGPAIALGDEASLVQVFRNLLGNAVRHTPADSPIEVVVDGVDDDLVISVRDHGPGLDPQLLARAFERFWRADGGRAAGGGSGLGLSIAREIVEQHAGTLTLHDRGDDGGGLEARITLPASPQRTVRVSDGTR